MPEDGCAKPDPARSRLAIGQAQIEGRLNDVGLRDGTGLAVELDRAAAGNVRRERKREG